MNDFEEPPKPKIVNNSDYLDKALNHLKNFDLPACANYLRKECELRMKYLLPENLAKKETEEETKYNQLENMISVFLKYYSETLHQDITSLSILKEKKDLILNPLSHDNLGSEIYKSELLDLHNLLSELRKIKKVQVLSVDKHLNFEQEDTDGDKRIYKVITKENLHYYKTLDGSIVCNNAQCEFVEFDKNGAISSLNNHPAKLKDLQKVAHTTAMKEQPLANYPDYLQEFKNEEGKTFQEILDEHLS